MERSSICPYWCFNCERAFVVKREVLCCPNCRSEAIEMGEGGDANKVPVGYQPYQIPPPPPGPNAPPPPNPITITAHRVFQFGPTTISMSTTNSVNQMTINMPQMPMNPFSLSQMFGGMVEGFIGPNGIMSLLNTLSGERNLTPASPADLSKLTVIPHVNECSICQESDQGQENRGEEYSGFRLQCGHCFHKVCLTPWLEKTNTCPSCRQRL